jgi:hypothetical protein
MNPEVIRAFTPVFLATVGGALGLAVIFAPTLEDDQRASGIGLAGTAIAGAAGLAQNTRNEGNITAAPNAHVEVDNTKQPTHENAVS